MHCRTHLLSFLGTYARFKRFKALQAISKYTYSTDNPWLDTSSKTSVIIPFGEEFVFILKFYFA